VQFIEVSLHYVWGPVMGINYSLLGALWLEFQVTPMRASLIHLASVSTMLRIRIDGWQPKPG